MHQTLPTPDDIAFAKGRMEKRAEALGLSDVPPVFQKGITKKNITFLYTWITEGQYNHIVQSDGYAKLAQENPQKAEKYLETQILQECLLWPPDFTPADPVKVASYPAGIIPTLYKAIMTDSGFDPGSGADRVIVPAEEPKELTPEEKAALIKAHPLAARFNIIGERMFTSRELDPVTGKMNFFPTRYYMYTAVDRETYAGATATGSEQGFNDALLKAAIIYPTTVNWQAEPAGYADWLVNAILVQSGFTDDDPSYEVASDMV